MKRVVYLSIALVGLFSSAALASPLDTPRLGGYNFSGPVEPSVTSIYHNPAATGQLFGTHFLVSGGFNSGSTTYDRTGGRPVYDYNFQTNTANILEEEQDPVEGTSANVLTNTFLGFTSDFGSEVIQFGLAVYWPYAQYASYDEDNAGAEHLIKIDSSIMAITPALTYKITPRFSVGISASYYKAEISELIYKESLAYLFTDPLISQSKLLNSPIEPELNELESTVTLANMTDDSLGAYTLGLHWIPARDWSLGFSFTTPMTMKYDGDVSIKAPNFEYTVPGNPASSSDADQEPTNLAQVAASNLGFSRSEDSYIGNSYMEYNLPMKIRLGTRWTPSREMLFDFLLEYAGWSAHDKWTLSYRNVEGSNGVENSYLERKYQDSLGIEYEPSGRVYRHRGWQDAIKVGLGGAWLPTDEFRVGGNFIVETSAVPDSAVNLAAVDSTKFDIMFAGEYSPVEQLWISLGLGAIIYSSVGVSGSDFSFDNSPEDGTYLASADGNYDMSPRIGGGLTVRYSFGGELELTR
jgi:long-subunit fatty acid transport protein